MENHKLLLSVKDLHVNFRVRGRTLSAIRGISLDFHEDESVAIVGESGSGKSVFTKTFAGMLDSNGYISEGSIIFHDEELADTVVALTDSAKHLIYSAEEKLNEYAKLENGAATYQAMEALKLERKHKAELSEEEQERLDGEIAELKYQRTELFNLKQTFDSSKEKDRIKEAEAKIEDLDRQIKAKEKEKADTIAAHKQQLQHDTAYLADYDKRMSELKSRYEKEIVVPISDAVKARNAILAKEICLSVGRFSARKRSKYSHKLLQALRHAMEEGRDLNDDAVRNAIFDEITFRVKYLDETPEKLHGTCVLNLAKIRDNRDWVKIRGNKIATVFQDPMTSLNPIITIGKQITSVILEHQNCSEIEARARALELMKKVGIPNAESRFDDYPFQYSGGMRQRIVIAIGQRGRPRGRAVRRTGCGTGHCGRYLLRSAPSLHVGAAVVPPPAGAAQYEALFHYGHAAVSLQQNRGRFLRPQKPLLSQDRYAGGAPDVPGERYALCKDLAAGPQSAED